MEAIELKKAETDDEFEQIHKLNYKTFVEEIPQHQINPNRILIDRFHDRNQFIIAKRGSVVIGMVCYNTKRPFSLDNKVNDLDFYLPKHNKLAEIRLLAISKEERKISVAYRLLKKLSKVLIEEGTDLAVISGTTLQLKLYKTLGFVPFYHLVGNPNAQFQPMYVTINALRNDFKLD